MYGAGLDWFFRPWLTREGRPQLTFDWSQGAGTVEITVEQPADNVYRLPLPVRIQSAQGPPQDFVEWIDGPRTTFTLAVHAPAVAVALDPDLNWLLSVQERNASLPALQVALPYPNPFNPQLTVTVLPRDVGRVTADVFDVRGRFVRRLFQGDMAARSSTALTWDATDDTGRRVASGVYTVRVTDAAGNEQTVRATLAR